MSAASRTDRPVRILLVDDHPVVRDGLAEAINREADLKVCAVAEDRAGALKAVQDTSPGLAVIDLTLKDSSGLELIKDLQVQWPELLILVVSMHEENLYAERVLRAGARGYMTKQQATRDIVSAIRRVLAGGIYLNEATTSAVLSRLTSKPGTTGGSPLDCLTDRELQIFELTGTGLSTREIATRLRIDIKTVDTYRTRIKEKLGLTSSSQLLQMAIQWGRKQ